MVFRYNFFKQVAKPKGHTKDQIKHTVLNEKSNNFNYTKVGYLITLIIDLFSSWVVCDCYLVTLLWQIILNIICGLWSSMRGNVISSEWQIDLIETQEIAGSNYGIRHIFTCLDLLSKKGWAISLKNKEAATYLVALKKFITDSKRKPKYI